MKNKNFILNVSIALLILLVLIPTTLIVLQRNDYLYGITSVAILAMMICQPYIILRTPQF